MKTLSEKIRVPLAVLMSAALIIGVAAAICAVFRGDADNAYRVNEVVSEISADDADIQAVFAFNDTELCLPENYSAEFRTITERTEKRYTEKELKSDTGSITVRVYNYAYMVEDDNIKIPDSAEKFTWQDTDVFIFENRNSTCTAVYYKGLARYTITEECSVEEMMELFRR